MKTQYWNFTWGIISTLLLITVMAVGVQAACVNPGGTGGCYTSIQAAINAASHGETINVAAGTYGEALNITTAGLKIIGDDQTTVIIDPTGKASNNAGIYVDADNVTLQSLTLRSTVTNSLPRYGIKFGAVDGCALEDVTVRNVYRSGVDALGASNLTISNVSSLDNGGHGLSLVDCNDVTVTDITLDGNGWQNVSVATWGRYTPLGTSGIVFTGNNNFGDLFQLEMGDYNNPGVPPAGEAVITYSTNPADGADVTVQASDFGFALHGEQDDSPDQARIWFFSTLTNAAIIPGLGGGGHWTGNDMYIESLTAPMQLYVTPGCSIQAAIDAADPGDTINVEAGTYVENPTIDKPLTIQGSGPTSTYVIPTGIAPVFTVSADDVTIKQIGITQSTQLVEGIRVVSPATSGLTLDYVNFPNLGNNPGPGNAYGVNIKNSFTGLSVTNSEFIATNLGEYSRAIGIFAGNDYLLRDFEVHDSTFEYLFVGVYLRSDIDGLNVTGNTFGPFELADCKAAVAGIYIGDGSQDNFDIQNITVTENTFTNYGRGVYMWNYSHGDIIGKVDITNNTFTNSIWSSGIRFIGKLDPATQVATLEGPITIDNNTFTQSVDIGGSGGVAQIDFRAGGESATSQIAVTDNDITFNGSFSSATHGIIFRGPITNATVSGNTLNGSSAGGTNGGPPYTSGIIVATDDSWLGPLSSNAVLDISNNVITGFENGIAVYDGNTSTFGNLPTGADLSIHNNSITANTLGINSGPGELTDASGNWWGTNTSSVVASQVTAAAVDYTPWLDKGTDIGDPGFHGDFSTLHIDDNSPQVGTIGRIQEAIERITGSTIYIAAGTYTENINVNTFVEMIGAGSGSDPASNTIITQTTAGAGDTKIGVVQLSASGTSGNPILLQDMRLEPVGMAGISVGRFTESTGQTVEYVKLDNVQVVGTNVNPSTEQERGLYVDLTSTLRYLDVDDCAFDNLTYGWYLQKAVSADASTVQYVTVDNTTFNHNNHKGLYAEKLSDATFTECTADGNGFDSSVLPSYFAPWSAGIDINLKAGDYANLVFMSCTITNNATDDAKEGVGLTVKARDDGSTYGVHPATLTNVTIEDGLFSGNERGIRIGEPTKNNAGPTNVQIHYNNIAGNVQSYSGTDGSEYGGLINHAQAQVNATCNWWGADDGPSGEGSGSGNAVSSNVEFIPWLLGPAPGGECGGYPKGDLTVLKTVAWNGFPADQAQTFEICITGPAFPGGTEQEVCQQVGLNGGTLTWEDLIIGEYTVTETDPGALWTINIAGSPVTVDADSAAQVDVTNTHAEYTKLKLTSMCSDDPDVMRRWRVRNLNPYDVEFTYQVYGTSQSGTYMAPANSDFFFETDTVDGANTTKILVNGVQQDVKASGGAHCTGNLEVNKTVNWNGFPTDGDQIFEICISGPLYPDGDCKTVGSNGGSSTWENLWVGEYQVTETAPGDLWSTEIADSPAAVTEAGAQVSVVNTHEAYTKLKLTSVCSEDPDVSRRWRVRNSNPYDVDFTYVVYGTSQSGSLTAPANSDLYFETDTVGGANTTIIKVNGIQQDVKASSGEACSDNISIEKNQDLEFDRGSDPFTETPFVHHGDEIMYSIEVTNTFGQAVDVLVSDAMSAYVDYLADSLTIYKNGLEFYDPDKEDSISYDDTLDVFSLAYVFNSLGINETLKLEFLVQVEDAVPIGEWIENFAIVTVIIPELTFDVESNTVRVEVVPEPATLFLIGAGLFGIAALARRKRKQQK